MKLFLRWLLVLVVGSLAFSLQASPLAVGDAVPAIVAKDQFGNPFTLTTNLQFLLVAVEMNSAKMANHKLAEQGSDFLETNRAAYLMDIHTMPAVARWFAFPKLRKYPHKIVLIDSAEGLSAFPMRTNSIAVLKLTSMGRIEKVSYWNPASEAPATCFR